MQTQPGGIVEIDDRTGEFVDYFGPGPERDPSDSGPTYMYDFAMTPDGESGDQHDVRLAGAVRAGNRPGLPRRRGRRLGRHAESR